MSFKIVTWNINGIRSSQQDLKQLFDSLEADIICLQETKITRDMLDEPTAFVEGYTSYYSFSRKRSGYSGVATYCRETVTPIKAEEGIAGMFGPHDDDVGNYDHIHSNFTDEALKDLDLEGRCIITQHKVLNGELVSLVVINVYCPHAEADNEERMAYKLQFYKALELRCRDMIQQGFHVILLGDINTSHQLIDHCEPDDADSFSKTPSRQWLSRFLSETEGEKFIDAFRFLHPNQEKSFTCWNTKTNARINNYGTRIDYILLSPKLRTSLKDCTIMSDVYGSDHCPVKATLELAITPSTKLPHICTRNFKEFSGKQLKMSTFLCKRSLTSSTETPIAVSQSKKMRTSKTKQPSIQAFFTQPSSNPVLNDEAPTSSNSSTESKTTVPYPEKNDTPSAAAQMWKSVFKGPSAPPTCKVHNEPCSLRTVRKKGPNMNRQFWTCSRAAGHSNDPQAQCNFFLWASSKR